MTKLANEIAPQIDACLGTNWPITGKARRVKINIEQTQQKKEMIARYDQGLFMRKLSPEDPAEKIAQL